jgi:putative ABC transport system permease protein
MRTGDLLSFATQSLLRARMRSSMMLLAMAIGVAAVVMLTALGEGARRYVTSEFSALGSNLIVVFPGRTETGGLNPAMMGGDTPRDLTIADAASLLKLPTVAAVAPATIGQATVSVGRRERDTTLMGSTRSLFQVRRWGVRQGDMLPDIGWDQTASVCVIGVKIAHELFPASAAVGQSLRIGDRRFRVVGVLGSEGRSMGFDVQELILVPVATAQAIYNRTSLFRVLIQARSPEDMQRTRTDVVEAIKRRHQGVEDVTVVTQDALLSTFNSIFVVLTAALGAIAAISLLVAGVLVMNVMLVAVSQRTAEIGLMKALGARPRQITLLFLTEAVLLALLGSVIGLGFGELVTGIARQFLPFDAVAPLWAVVLGVLIAITCGLVFGIMPARRAARLDPVLALAGKV